MELAEAFVQTSSILQGECGTPMWWYPGLTCTGQDLGSAATYHALFKTIFSIIVTLFPPQDTPLAVPVLALHQQINNWIVGH